MALLVVAGCRITRIEQPRQTPTAVTSQAQRASQFFDSVEDQPFHSIDDAEKFAGYPILRPGTAYPMGFNQTIVRSSPGERRGTSMTSYTYPPTAPTSIQVVVGPQSDWDQIDGTSGEQILSFGMAGVIGGREGYFSHSDGGFNFAFRFGRIDDQLLWCDVYTTDKIGRSAFDTFVTSLH